MIRKIFILACTAGGVWGTLHLLQQLAGKVGTADEFSLSGEGLLLAIPIGMVGACLGALLGSLVFPAKS